MRAYMCVLYVVCMCIFEFKRGKCVRERQQTRDETMYNYCIITDDGWLTTSTVRQWS